MKYLLPRIASILRSWTRQAQSILGRPVSPKAAIARAAAIAVPIAVGMAFLIMESSSMVISVAIAATAAVTLTAAVSSVIRAYSSYHMESREYSRKLLRDFGAAQCRILDTACRYDLESGRVMRRMTVENQTNRPAFFVTYSAGATDEVPELRASQLDMQARSEAGEREATVLLDTGREKSSHHEYRVVLTPPLQPASQTVVRITYKWDDLWKPLFVDGEDYGSYRSSEETRSLTLEFVFPRGYKGSVIPLLPRAGEVAHEHTEDDRNIVKWHLRNAPPYSVEYQLVMTKPSESDL